MYTTPGLVEQETNNATNSAADAVERKDFKNFMVLGLTDEDNLGRFQMKVLVWRQC